MADEWLVLSDRPVSETSDGPELLESGVFVLELTLPLAEPAVLLDFHASQGWDRTFALFHEPSVGLVLVHRQGKVVVRHALTGTLPQISGTGRLSLHFDAPARHWSMRFDVIGGEETPTLISEGQNPLPLRPADLHALSLPHHRAKRHAAVLWFGLTKGGTLPARAPWIGQRTPISTLRGTVLAGNLKPGDMVRTADGGLLPLRRIRRLDLPSCGSFAPVILRAPFFGQSHDLLVSSDQRIAISGPEVEYLFNVDEVLIEAGALVDGKSALSEQRRPVTTSLILDFDHPALLDADGCTLLSARQGDAPLRRMLKPFEVLTLMALLGRAGHRRVA